MRQLHTLFISFVAACALLVGPAAARGPAKPALQVDKFTSTAEQVVWLAYGLGLNKFITDHNLIETLPTGTWKPSFEAEVSAREFQLKVWGEITQKQNLKYAFMDQMESIASAGFLKEYVWRYYKRAGWDTPDGLRMSEFNSWAAVNLDNHRPITGAKIAIKR